MNLDISLCYLETPFVAFRINWAISFGWDTGDAWLEGSEIVVEFICFAKTCSAAGGIIRSFSDTSYHVGICFQTGGHNFSAKIDRLGGFCVTAMILAWA